MRMDWRTWLIRSAQARASVSSRSCAIARSEHMAYVRCSCRCCHGQLRSRALRTRRSLLPFSLRRTWQGAPACRCSCAWFRRPETTVSPSAPAPPPPPAPRPPRARAIAAVLIGMVALGVGLGPAAGVYAIALMAAAFASLAWLSVRQIGGQTGDVLGALEQIGEIVVLLVAAANMGGLLFLSPIRRRRFGGAS